MVQSIQLTYQDAHLIPWHDSQVYNQNKTSSDSQPAHNIVIIRCCVQPCTVCWAAASQYLVLTLGAWHWERTGCVGWCCWHQCTVELSCGHVSIWVPMLDTWSDVTPVSRSQWSLSSLKMFQLVISVTSVSSAWIIIWLFALQGYFKWLPSFR